MRSAGRVFIIMVLSAVILFAVVCGALFAFQRSLIYYPQPRSNPEGSILMTLPVGTATVHVSTRPHVGPAALIYFGGNAEDVSQDIAPLFPAAEMGFLRDGAGVAEVHQGGEGIVAGGTVV